MPPSARPVALLAGTLLLGWLAGTSDVELAAALPWPIGLVTGCVLLQRRRLPAVAVLAVALPGMAAGLALTGWGRDAVGVSLAHITGVAVAVLVLTSAGRRRASLLSESDIGRFIGACVAGATAAAGVMGVWCALLEARLGTDEMAAMITTHVASQLVVVPFFLRRHDHAALGSRTEQVACWALTLTVTFLV